MTAYALITGVVFRTPLQRTSRAGKPYTTCTVRAGTDDSASAAAQSIPPISRTEIRYIFISPLSSIVRTLFVKIAAHALIL